jgi:hypothetical protein
LLKSLNNAIFIVSFFFMFLKIKHTHFEYKLC